MQKPEGASVPPEAVAAVVSPTTSDINPDGKRRFNHRRVRADATSVLPFPSDVALATSAR